jgi:hypothetical protein
MEDISFRGSQGCKVFGALEKKKIRADSQVLALFRKTLKTSLVTGDISATPVRKKPSGNDDFTPEKLI